MAPPRNERINFVFTIDADGDFEKLRSTTKTPHSGKGGEFLWVLTNSTGSDIEVSLRKFRNKDGLDVNDFLKFHPRDVLIQIPGDPDDNVRNIRGTIKKVNAAKVLFTYEVWVGENMIDPELEIDGGGGDPGDPKAKKKGRKKK